MPHSTLNTLCAGSYFYSGRFEKINNRKQQTGILDSHDTVNQGHRVGFGILLAKDACFCELCFLFRKMLRD